MLVDELLGGRDGNLAGRGELVIPSAELRNWAFFSAELKPGLWGERLLG